MRSSAVTLANNTLLLRIVAFINVVRKVFPNTRVVIIVFAKFHVMFLIEHAHLRIFNDKKISRMDDRYKSFFLGTLVHGHYCLITEILPAVRK